MKMGRAKILYLKEVRICKYLSSLKALVSPHEGHFKWKKLSIKQGKLIFLIINK